MHRLVKLKKAQIAAEAGRLAAGSGWLPVMFRTPEAATIGQAEIGPGAGVDRDSAADAQTNAETAADGVELDAEEETDVTA